MHDPAQFFGNASLMFHGHQRSFDTPSTWPPHAHEAFTETLKQSPVLVDVRYSSSKDRESALPAPFFHVFVSSILPRIVSVVYTTELGQDNLKGLGVCREGAEVGGDKRTVTA